MRIKGFFSYDSNNTYIPMSHNTQLIKITIFYIYVYDINYTFLNFFVMIYIKLKCLEIV